MNCLKSLILALLVTFITSQNLFNLFPKYTIATNLPNAVLVQMDAGESNVIVAFDNGTVITMNFNGIYTPLPQTNHSHSILQIDSFPNYIMALDSGSNLIVWNTTGNGSLILNQFLNNSATNVAWRQINSSTLIVAVNFGDNCTEYQLSSGGLTLTGTTYSYSNGSLNTAIYSGDGNWLVAGTDSSQVITFNASSGLVASTSNLSNSSNIQGFSLLNNQNIVGVADSFMTYLFDTGDSTFESLNPLINPYIFTGCPSSLIVSGHDSDSNIDVYSIDGIKIEELNYVNTSTVSIDCSQTYLVSLDGSGNVAITTYSDIDISLKKLEAWIIAIIVVGAVLFFAGIIVIICCCRRRKLALQASINITGKQLMIKDNIDINFKPQIF